MTPPTIADLREEVARLERAREEISESALRLTDDDEVAAENLAGDLVAVVDHVGHGVAYDPRYG